METLNHFFLHCPRFTNEKQNFLLKIERMVPKIFRKTDSSTQYFFKANPSFSAEINTKIINSSIDYNLSRKRFESTLRCLINGARGVKINGGEGGGFGDFC